MVCFGRLPGDSTQFTRECRRSVRSAFSEARIIIERFSRSRRDAQNLDVPPASMSIMVDAALARIKSRGPTAMADLSIGSAAVADAVSVGFDRVRRMSG